MVTTLPRLTGVAERMDDPSLDARELAKALKALARVNRLFGGTQIVLYHLPRLCDGLPARVRVLDVGTGYADIPRAIVRWARRRGQPVEITALDRNPGTLTAAARACADYAQIELLRGNALELPFPPHSFDVVLASQVLHHMEAGEPARLLGELRRVARHGILVHDLRRGAWPHAVTWAALQLMSRNPSSDTMDRCRSGAATCPGNSRPWPERPVGRRRGSHAMPSFGWPSWRRSVERLAACAP
jgi:SAM-dependent methyltransferase